MSWDEVIDKLKKGETPEGVQVHVTKTTQPDDYYKLNPNSLETDCTDCNNYYVITWKEGEEPPRKLVCPQCGSSNHGCVGSPAGAMHLAMFDPMMP